MGHAYITLLFFLLSLPALGTCIVIYRTPKEIYVAADSRRELIYMIPATGEITKEYSDEYCKIRSYGQFTFAVAGFDDEGMHGIVKNIAITHKTPDDVLINTAGKIKDYLTKKVEDTRINNRSYYIERFSTPSVAQIAVCFYANKKPTVILFDFTLTNKPNQPTNIKVDFDENRIITVMGVYDTIIKNPQKAVEEQLAKSPVTTLNKLITKQGAATPNWVGGLTEVLLINSKGRQWKSHKKNCL